LIAQFVMAASRVKVDVAAAVATGWNVQGVGRPPTK
jgi:hypothetical protein